MSNQITTDSEPEYYDSAFVIDIQNLTKNRLDKVSLLNHDFKDQPDIHYSSPHNDYSLILRQLSILKSEEKYKITRLSFECFSTDKDSAVNQLNTSLMAKHSFFDGRCYAICFPLSDFPISEPDSSDFADGLSLDLHFDRPITMCYMLDFELEYLLPETKIRVLFVYKSPRKHT